VSLSTLPALLEQMIDLALDRLHFTSGSIKPVGLIICSTTSPLAFVSSYGPGVADT
jgi:hypothetical protein